MFDSEEKISTAKPRRNLPPKLNALAFAASGFIVPSAVLCSTFSMVGRGAFDWLTYGYGVASALVVANTTHSAIKGWVSSKRDSLQSLMTERCPSLPSIVQSLSEDTAALLKREKEKGVLEVSKSNPQFDFLSVRERSWLEGPMKKACKELQLINVPEAKYEVYQSPKTTATLETIETFYQDRASRIARIGALANDESLRQLCEEECASSHLGAIRARYMIETLLTVRI